MNKLRKISVVCGFIASLSGYVYATPSTQIWNPSTDIQAEKTLHLGIDNYFSVFNNADKPYALPTDIGLTYGLLKNLEVGIDFMEPSADPLYFNAKYGLPENGMVPALAVGAFSVGTKTDSTNYNILYGAAAKVIKPVGRVTLGYYSGNSKLLLDDKGESANTGFIATWDRQLTDKIWASVDYASGQSFYGCLSYGLSYAFAPNTGVIVGYVVYNNTAINQNNQFSTQLDINF